MWTTIIVGWLCASIGFLFGCMWHALLSVPVPPPANNQDPAPSQTDFCNRHVPDHLPEDLS